MWRHLPGPLPVRLLTALVALTAVVLALMIWVFPAAAPLLPFTHVTVTPSTAGTPGP